MITGESGCGKSTLLRIMLGLLQPTNGRVYVNGTPVSRVITAEDPPRFAAVMQDDQLFQGTIAENITFFQDKDEINELLLKRATRICGLENIAEKLPMKLDSLISGNGVNFSGGQRQRILIARALYTNPSVIFMDEATSQLDILSQQALMEEIRNEGITQVHVSHRESIFRIATQVFELPLENCNKNFEIAASDERGIYGPST